MTATQICYNTGMHIVSTVWDSPVIGRDIFTFSKTPDVSLCSSSPRFPSLTSGLECDGRPLLHPLPVDSLLHSLSFHRCPRPSSLHSFSPSLPRAGRSESSSSGSTVGAPGSATGDTRQRCTSRVGRATLALEECSSTPT